MATIEFNAYKIHEVRRYFSEVTQKVETSCTISFGIGTGAPFPSETIEATKLKDIEPAFEAYVEKAKASGLMLQLRVRVAKGTSPRGLKDARLVREVNIPEATDAAA